MRQRPTTSDAQSSQSALAEAPDVATVDGSAGSLGLFHEQFGNGLVGGALSGSAVDALSLVVANEAAGAVSGMDFSTSTPSNAMMLRLMRRAEEQLDTDSAARDIASSSGRALDSEQLERFEKAFDHSFDHVRVHVDGAAAKAAETLQAYAFALGADIYFRSSTYAPGTTAGDRLLAHELTHVVQHDENRLPAATEGMEVSSPSSAPEREAYANEGVILKALDVIDAEMRRGELGLFDPTHAIATSGESATDGDAPNPASVFDAQDEVSGVLGEMPGADSVSDALARGGVTDIDPDRQAETIALIQKLSFKLGISQIEVRSDEAATSRLRALGTRGAMEGGEVLLDGDAYDPHTSDGRSLLAHEVMHLAQGQLPAGAETSGDLVEGEAQTFASAFASGFATPGVAMAMPSGHSAHEGGGGPNVKELYAQFEAAKKAQTDTQKSTNTATAPPGQTSPNGVKQNRDKKMEQFEDGLEEIADALEDMGAFSDLGDALDDDDTAARDAAMSRVRGTEKYKQMWQQWQAGKDSPEDGGAMKDAWSSKFTDRGWGDDELAWNYILARAKEDARVNAEAEAAKAQLAASKRAIPAVKEADKAKQEDAAAKAGGGPGKNGSLQDRAAAMSGVEVPQALPEMASFSKSYAKRSVIAPEVQKEWAHYDSHSKGVQATAGGGVLARGGDITLSLGKEFAAGYAKGLVGGAQDGLTDTIADFGDKALTSVTKGKMPGGVSYIGSAVTLYQSGLLTGDFDKFGESQKEEWGKVADGHSKAMGNWEKAGQLSGVDAFGMYCASIADWLGCAIQVMENISSILGILSAICYVVGGILILVGLGLVWLAGIGAPMITAGGWLIRGGQTLDKIQKVVDAIVAILKPIQFLVRLIAAFTVPADAYAEQLNALNGSATAFGESSGKAQGSNTVAQLKEKATQPDDKKQDQTPAPEGSAAAAGDADGKALSDKKQAEIETHVTELEKGKQLAVEGNAAADAETKSKGGDEESGGDKKKEVSQADVDALKKQKSPEEEAQEKSLTHKILKDNQIYQAATKGPLSMLKEAITAPYTEFGKTLTAATDDLKAWKETPELVRYETLSEVDLPEGGDPRQLGPNTVLAEKAMAQLEAKKNTLKAGVDQVYAHALQSRKHLDELKAQLKEAEEGLSETAGHDNRALTERKVEIERELKKAETQFEKAQTQLEEADTAYKAADEKQKEWAQKRHEGNQTEDGKAAAQKRLDKANNAIKLVEGQKLAQTNQKGELEEAVGSLEVSMQQKQEQLKQLKADQSPESKKARGKAEGELRSLRESLATKKRHLEQASETLAATEATLESQRKTAQERQLAVDGPAKPTPTELTSTQEVMSVDKKGIKTQETKAVLGLLINAVAMYKVPTGEPADAEEAVDPSQSKEEKQVADAAKSLLESSDDKQKEQGKAEAAKNPFTKANEWWSGLGKSAQEGLMAAMGGSNPATLLEKAPPHEPEAMDTVYTAAESEAEAFTKSHNQAYSAYQAQIAASGQIAVHEKTQATADDELLPAAAEQQKPLDEGKKEAAARKAQVSSLEMGTKKSDPEGGSLVQGLIERLMSSSDYVEEGPGDETSAMQGNASGAQDKVDDGAKASKDSMSQGSDEQILLVGQMEQDRVTTKSKIETDKAALQAKIGSEKVTSEEINVIKIQNLEEREAHKANAEAKATEYNTMMDAMTVWASEYRTKREEYAKSGGV